MMSRRWIFISMALAVVACQPKPSNATKDAATPALPNDVAAVAAVADTADGSNGAVEITDPEAHNGKLLVTGEFISPEVSNVASKIPGRVARIFVDEGERVRAGQPILELEKDYLELDVKRAQAELDRAQAAVAEANRDLDRKTELRQKNSIPQATFDRVKSTYDQSNAALEVARAGLDTAKQRLADSVLRSPFDGVVVERRTAAGERLGDATVAFVIARTAPLRLRFNVSERYVSSVHDGQEVTATVEAYPGETFTGAIDVVGQTVDPSSRTFFIEVSFPNKDGRLRPGLFARTEIDLLPPSAMKG